MIRETYSVDKCIAYAPFVYLQAILPLVNIVHIGDVSGISQIENTFESIFLIHIKGACLYRKSISFEISF